jgi:hypothetical protein
VAKFCPDYPAAFQAKLALAVVAEAGVMTKAVINGIAAVDELLAAGTRADVDGGELCVLQLALTTDKPRW